jgi:hypothetical protein
MGRMEWRSQWSAAAVGLAVALGLLSTAAASAAERKEGVESPVQPYAFTLASSKGFSIYGFSSKLSRGRGRTGFSLMAERGREVAEYAVPAKLTKKGIWADFGKIGRVALRFHPTGKIEEARLPCIGKSFPVSEGYYVGKIRFDGTEGFTAVRANRATGDIQPALGLICRDTYREWAGPPGAILQLERWRKQSSKITFDVVKTGLGDPVHFYAGIAERHGRLSVYRGIDAMAGVNTFTFQPQTETALIAPPEPFSGAGTFVEEASGVPSRWTGDLRVDFPGRAHVSLTGPGFSGEIQTRGSRTYGPLPGI